jgi:LmbE family N-acetylglucosaminyl deacetylase
MKLATWSAAFLLPFLPLSGPVGAQTPVVERDGAAALGVALRQLGTTKRVLMIAAHPDDENTALLAELALGDGADVAYLSLTRGEGGQNLIGPELNEGLGLIRTGELLAARRLDGAQQFFTRAYDYGFSKSAGEAFTQWPRDSLLADVAAVVRAYQPDIVVSVFSGTPADGHGQHQAAGMLARDVFAAVTRVTPATAVAHRPHAPRYLFQALYRPPPDARLRVATGDLDPLFGRSRYQIAMQSRSRHRSQDMGRGEPLGPQTTMLSVLAGPYPDGSRSLFAGLDTTLSQHARTAGAGDEVVSNLAAYEADVASIRASYNPLVRAALVDRLNAAIRRLDVAQSLLLEAQAVSSERHTLSSEPHALPGGPRYADLLRLIADERAQAGEALRLDAGIVVDVTADTRTPVPGESFTATVTVWNGGPRAATFGWARLHAPRGWTVTTADSSARVTIEPNAVLRRAYRVTLGADAAVSEPYFLRAPRDGAVYSYDGVPDSIRGLPFEPPPLRAEVALSAGSTFRVVREAEYLDIDKAVGEVRRPLLVLPRAAVTVEPRTLVVRTGDTAPRSIAVNVSTLAPRGVAGTLRLVLPDAWRADRTEVPVQLARAGDARTVQFTLTPPPDARGTANLRAVLEADGRTYDRGYTIIDYPHIRPQPLYRDAVVAVSSFDVRIADGLLVGYIEGAGDDGAEALRQLGARVEMLDAAALANGDLSRYHAIVAGIRAYEVRSDILAHNDRLLDYARDGGTFIVQYNKYELVDGEFMPYPASMARPHGRVTDEHAPVTLLAPEHPLLRGPNRITAADFDGWVQERGLYFLDAFDERYTPLLAMADEGEEALHGALVAARVGSGWYVYTGLALFRQLPAGVPGAYRLLANLVSLGAQQP